MYILSNLLILFGLNWNFKQFKKNDVNKNGTEDYTGLEAISAGWGDYRLVF